MSLKPKVIQLYKTLLYMGRDHPTGYESFRDKVRKAFHDNRSETDENKVKKMILHGRYVVKELEALYKLKKYRAMKKRYYQD